MGFAGNQRGHDPWRIAPHLFACSENFDHRVAVCCGGSRRPLDSSEVSFDSDRSLRLAWERLFNVREPDFAYRYWRGAGGSLLLLGFCDMALRDPASRPDRGFGVRDGMDYLIIELESLLLQRGRTSADIIRATGHTPANISKIRNGKVKAIRLKTLLDICVELDCQPGDLIKRVSERELDELAMRRARKALSRATTADEGSVLESDRVYVVDLRND